MYLPPGQREVQLTGRYEVEEVLRGKHARRLGVHLGGGNVDKLRPRGGGSIVSLPVCLRKNTSFGTKNLFFVEKMRIKIENNK